MAELSLSGALTALVTPFTADAEQVDYDAFERLVEEQLAAKISGLVPCGTTGETPTLSDAEQRELIRRTSAIAKGRVPVIAGTGSNSTKKTIASSLAALEAGADAVMVVMPYYNKPSQAGLVRHIQLVAKAVSAPIVLYNIPGRSAVELKVDATLEVLESCPNVVAIKDATGGVLYCQELLSRVGDRVTILSGDDPLTLSLMSVGAKGVISVTSNVYPAQVVRVAQSFAAGKLDQAIRQHLELFPVHRALFAEPNPQPVKAALAMKGKMNAQVRPPLIEASEACRERLAATMKKYEAS